MNKLTVELLVHLYSPCSTNRYILRDEAGNWQGIPGLHSMISNISLSFPKPSKTIKSEFIRPDLFILIREISDGDTVQLVVRFDSEYKLSNSNCWQLGSIEFNGSSYNDFMSARRAVQWFIWNLFDQDKITA